MFDLDREIKAAQERLHRSIGQKCRHELVRIRANFGWLRFQVHAELGG